MANQNTHNIPLFKLGSKQVSEVKLEKKVIDILDVQGKVLCRQPICTEINILGPGGSRIKILSNDVEITRDTDPEGATPNRII